MILIRAGVMLEKAFALIYRSSFAAGDNVSLVPACGPLLILDAGRDHRPAPR